jgi:pimeloyl-ACP methyl ester carboxylesterase
MNFDAARGRLWAGSDRITRKTAMDPFSSLHDLSAWQNALLACVAVLIILAVVNHILARQAEREHPPTGSFIEVDGIRLHYSDRGAGSPIVLLHGNAVTGDDYNTSGVAERLLANHRVLIFDRPGFGYSERPRWRPWAAAAQAELLHKAVAQLGVERPVVVGHSWGTLVALAFAARFRADTAGLVLLSGYYFPNFRLDALLVTVGAIPIVGDVLRYTISPLFGWLTMPLTKRMMFAPSPMTPRFKAEYSTAMALRPSQIRATVVDGAFMVPSAAGLRPHYQDLAMPVVIMAGAGDLVVSHRHAERLHATIQRSALQIVPGAGHMIHHIATSQVVQAITEVTGSSAVGTPSDKPGEHAPPPGNVPEAA